MSYPSIGVFVNLPLRKYRLKVTEHSGCMRSLSVLERAGDPSPLLLT